MEFSIDKFNEIKNEAEKFYEDIKSVYCPYLCGNVSFNSKGWEHLIFKEWNRTRIIGDQFIRFRHLKVAPEILRQSKTLQGLWTTNKFERIKRKDGWIKILKLITYYEFIAVVDSHGSKIRVKIIVKQIDEGEKFFLSIIPFWGVNKMTGERIMYSGNPEND
ncbi:MAG: hypothetical protein WC879_18880 [Melioribacteraceae bacterium]